MGRIIPQQRSLVVYQKRPSSGLLRLPTVSYLYFSMVSTSLMLRERRDLQPYPLPVVIICIHDRVLPIPDEIWWRVGAFCDAQSLHRLRSTHPRLRRLLLHNEAGWRHLCRTLWKNRYHISNETREMLEDDSDPYGAVRAYEQSKRDARRDFLTEDELCDSTWWFRFKHSAGEDWIRDDPWHRGEPAVRMVFLRNGTVRSDDIEMVIQWQWIEQPTLLEDDLPKDRGLGAYVRLTVSGRDVPTYVVRRFAANWGFIMENCWGIFASFELKLKTLPLRLSDNQAPGRPRKRRRCSVSEEDLTTELYFEISGQNQWREAFLYNIGARRIPHGANALEEFRHACEAALQARA